MKVETIGLGAGIKTGFETKLTERDTLRASVVTEFISKYGKSKSLIPEYVHTTRLSEVHAASEQKDPWINKLKFSLSIPMFKVEKFIRLADPLFKVVMLTSTTEGGK
jgi:hypothetical protein